MKISTKTTLLFLHIYLREMLRLILKENSFQFNGKHLQTHSTAMGKKTAVPFANIFMAYIETQLLSIKAKPTVFKPTVWKKYIDLWDVRKSDIAAFFAQAMVQIHADQTLMHF